MISKKNIVFYGLLGIYIATSAWLIQAISEVLKQDPSLLPFFFAHMLPVLQGSLILGIGFGLPLMLLSGILGWGQLLLLMHGHISPHLGKEGLLKVLNTLFSQL